MNPYQSPEVGQCQNDEHRRSIVCDVSVGFVIVAVTVFSVTAIMPLAWIIAIVFANKQRTIIGVTAAAMTRCEWWTYLALFPFVCWIWWYMVSVVIPDMYREFFTLYWS